MLQVMSLHGEGYLAEQYRPNRLSWQEAQALAGPGLVGLPLGYSAQLPEVGLC